VQINDTFSIEVRLALFDLLADTMPDDGALDFFISLVS
jgi:hypothetical protein